MKGGEISWWRQIQISTVKNEKNKKLLETSSIYMYSNHEKMLYKKYTYNKKQRVMGGQFNNTAKEDLFTSNLAIAMLRRKSEPGETAPRTRPLIPCCLIPLDGRLAAPSGRNLPFGTISNRSQTRPLVQTLDFP